MGDFRLEVTHQRLEFARGEKVSDVTLIFSVTFPIFLGGVE